jgi:hypothetical protein
MYKKMLHGRRILYFRYAPPVTNLDDISARETRPNDENDPGYMWSVYYYWWAFLRLSKAYKECCENGGTGDLADVYTYFGDVRDDDFMRWWTKGGHPQASKYRMHTGRRIFSHGIRFPIREINDPLLEKEQNADRVVLSIPVDGDLSRLTAEFQRLMRPVVEEHIRTHGEKKGEALFEVVSKNPSLKSLHKILTARQTEEDNPGLTRLELAKELGITERVVGDVAAYNALTRLLKKAEVLIRNVERGRFPDFTDYKEGELPELPRALRPKPAKRTERIVVIEDGEELSLF